MLLLQELRFHNIHSIILKIFPFYYIELLTYCQYSNEFKNKITPIPYKSYKINLSYNPLLNCHSTDRMQRQ